MCMMRNYLRLFDCRYTRVARARREGILQTRVALRSRPGKFCSNFLRGAGARGKGSNFVVN